MPNALSRSPLASLPNSFLHWLPSAQLPARMKQTFCSGLISPAPRLVLAELDFDSYVLYKSSSEDDDDDVESKVDFD